MIIGMFIKHFQISVFLSPPLFPSLMKKALDYVWTVDYACFVGLLSKVSLLNQIYGFFLYVLLGGGVLDIVATLVYRQLN